MTTTDFTSDQATAAIAATDVPTASVDYRSAPAADARPPLFRRRFTKPGDAPGKFAGDAVPDSSRVRLIRYDAGHFDELDDIEDHDLPPLPELGGEGVTWVDLRGVQDHEAVEAVAKHFGFNRLATADVVNVGQRPKAEDHNGRLFVVLRMAVRTARTTTTPSDHPAPSGTSPAATRAADARAEKDSAELKSISNAWRWEQFSLFLGEGFVVTFQEADGDCLDGLRRRLRNGAKALRHAGPDALATAIVDSVVDGYFPLLEDTGELLEELEDEVLAAATRDVLTDVYNTRRQLLTFRRATWPLRDVLAQLVRDGHPLLGEKVVPYLRDASDHAMQIADVLESYRELTGSLVDVHLSNVSNRTNETMRVLTIIATIFIPLTFIAGVYGMNFDDLPETHWKFGYAYFWAICALVFVIEVAVFRHLGWLGGRRSK